MKWVSVNNVHINTAQVQTFYWADGWLFVWFVGDTEPEKYKDRNREQYHKFCHLLGVRPLEGDKCG